MEMRAIVVREIGGFEITRASVREIQDDEVLLRVDVAGICRTDLKLIRVGHRDLTLPRIPGEEVIGVIQKKGKSVDAYEEGARVYVYPGVWCGDCPSCRRGAQNLCRGMQIMGFHRDGGFAEYVIAPAKSLILVPKELDAEQAVFAEPLSCCLNALELARVDEGDSVGIWGAGPAGTLLFRAAKALGASPASFDPDENRRHWLGGFASSEGKSFDVCIIAVGSKQAYVEALQALNPRGRLVVFSGLHPLEESLPVNFNQLHYYEQTLVGAYGCSYRHGRQALDLIASGAVSVRDMISHRIRLEELETGLEIVENRKGMKVLLYP